MRSIPLAPPTPAISQFSVTPGGPVTLMAQVYPGHTYRVELKDDLGDQAWIPLLGDVFATDTLLTFQDFNPSPAHRFYRVIRIN
jgi:hypothetical protein